MLLKKETEPTVDYERMEATVDIFEFDTNVLHDVLCMTITDQQHG